MSILSASSRSIVAELPHTNTPAHLDVYSNDFQEGQPIPGVHSANGIGYAPDIHWGNLPEGTKSLVLICEDPDARGPRPFVHWLLYNIDPRAANARDAIKGIAQDGTNSKGEHGYYGPCPPVGDAPHHYHFEVFALKDPLPLPLGAEREIILDAMAGRVLGKGDLIGTFAAPAA